jgi:hypothetical protein
VAVYLGALIFGGLLIVATVFGVGHDADAHGGDGGDASHDHGTGNALLSLFGLRFWSFGAAFFGLTGLVMRALGWPAVAPYAGALLGVAAGLGATAAFRALARDTVGQVGEAAAWVGREGRLLLPVSRAQRGKIRLPLPAGGHVDLLAESDEEELIAAGAEAMVVEVRGNVAVVTRGPGGPRVRA